MSKKLIPMGLANRLWDTVADIPVSQTKFANFVIEELLGVNLNDHSLSNTTKILNAVVPLRDEKIHLGAEREYARIEGMVQRIMAWDAVTYRQKAVQEFLYITAESHRVLYMKYHMLFKMRTCIRDMSTDLATYVYSKGRGWLVKPPNGLKLTTAFNGIEFQLCSRVGDHKVVCEAEGDILLLSEDINITRDLWILDDFEEYFTEVIAFDFESITGKLMNYIAGGGKTTYIVKHARLGVVPILVKGVQTKYDVLDRLNELYSDIPDFSVRTLDSATIATAVSTADEAVVDEAGQNHYGQVLFVMMKYGVRYAELYFDAAQIDYECRLAGFVPEYAKQDFPEEVHDVSHRIPLAGIPIVRQFGGAYSNCTTTNKRKGLFKVKKIHSIEEVRKGHGHYISYLQADKLQVERYISPRTNTITEYQGNQDEDIAVIRTVTHKIPIFDNPRHNLVAVTRTFDKLTYYTVDDNDALSNLITLQGMKDDTKEPEETETIYTAAVPRIYPVTLMRAPTYKSYRTHAQTKVFGYYSYLAIQFWMWFNNDSDIEYLKQRFEEFEIIDTHDEVAVDSAEIALIYESLFEIPDEMKRQALILEAEMHPPLTEISILWTKYCVEYHKQERDYLVPIYTTDSDGGKKRPGEVFAALIKRSLGIPKMQYPTEPTYAIEPLKKIIIHTLSEVKFNVNVGGQPRGTLKSCANWLSGKDSQTIARLEAGDWSYPDMTATSGFIKPFGKGSDKGDHNTTLAAGQVLSCTTPEFTAMMATEVLEACNKFVNSLDDKYIVATDMTDGQVSAHITTMLSRYNHERSKVRPDTILPETIAGLKGVDIDIRKFDKSQEMIALRLFLMIMKIFGVTEQTLDMMYVSGRAGRLTFKALGITLKVLLTQKSGAIETIFKNVTTIVGAAVLGLPIEHLVVAVFLGDDNMLWFAEEAVVNDNSELLGQLLNLEARVCFCPDAIYGLSKYWIVVDGRVIGVPDPIKRLKKLGHKGMYCREHVRFAWISFADNCKAYLNKNIRETLKVATIARNKGKVFTTAAIGRAVDLIAHLVRTPEAYVALWTGTEEQLERPLPLDIAEKLRKQLMMDNNVYDRNFELTATINDIPV